MLGTDGEAAGTDPGGSRDKVGTGPIRLNQSRSVHSQIVRQQEHTEQLPLRQT